MATWVLAVVGLASSVFFWAVAELAHLNKYWNTIYKKNKIKFIIIYVHIGHQLKIENYLVWFKIQNNKNKNLLLKFSYNNKQKVQSPHTDKRTKCQIQQISKMYNESVQFVAKNMWKITSGSLELIFYQEKLTMLKFEAFFSQITLCVSAVQVHQKLCLRKRSFDIRFIQQWMRMR